MNNNSKAIVILCSHLCLGDNINPLTFKEWEEMAERLLFFNMQPEDILMLTDQDMKFKLRLTDKYIERIRRLLDRSGSIAFEIEKYENIGIMLITRADVGYPQVLKKKLGSKCPPLFYVAGDMKICESPSIGFVGSRNIGEKELDATKSMVEIAVRKQYSIVSGGARGVDQVSLKETMMNDGKSITYVADSMLRKLKDKEFIRAVRNGQAVILSITKPDAAFNTGFAMMRNKYIYAQSKATVVIKSDYDKGGTWSGATEALRNSWCSVYCIDEPSYKGNQELIRKGAVPVNKFWAIKSDTISKTRKISRNKTQQLSILDNLAWEESSDYLIDNIKTQDSVISEVVTWDKKQVSYKSQEDCCYINKGTGWTMAQKEKLFERRVAGMRVTNLTKKRILMIIKNDIFEQIFGRVEISKTIGVNIAQASNLIKKMKEAGLIEAVHGHGRGKYSFVKTSPIIDEEKCISIKER